MKIQLSCVNDLECIVVNLNLSAPMPLTMMGIYRPLSTATVLYEKLNSLLKECDAKNEVILLGDFNIRWSDKAKSLKKAFNKSFKDRRG